MRTLLALILLAVVAATSLACSSPQPGCASAGCAGIRGPDAGATVDGAAE